MFRRLLVASLATALMGSAVVFVGYQLTAPETGGPSATPGRGAASLVSSMPVQAKVREVPLDGVDHRGVRALGSPAQRRRAEGDLAALSAPEPTAENYATIGVTWRRAPGESKRQLKIFFRTRDAGRWSGWQRAEYDYEHAPDLDGAEASARPGTDPIPVGVVDDVQVKVLTPSGRAPADLKLAVVDPGADRPVRQDPALGTAKVAATTLEGSGEAGTRQAVLASQPVDVTPSPEIFSRSQWGADESLRDRSSLSYGEVHAGIVHHTVNGNYYTREQVPALLRGIYAYHTQSRGWSDIGYNFIVDRFGRIWEGRYGGIDRPVVGAHTLGYNEKTFAMSALGNFETAQPTQAMLDSFGQLFAWKLSLHGVRPDALRQSVGNTTRPAVNGHSDLGQTACPGRYLYAKIPTIRTLATQYQRPFSARPMMTNISGSRWPDLVVRDKTTKRMYVLRTGGQVDFGRGPRIATGWAGMDLVSATGDLTGDGIPDMVGRNAMTKTTGIYPGTAAGPLGAPRVTTAAFAGADQLIGAGDLTGDGLGDMVARMAGTKRLFVYPGKGAAGFGPRRLLASDWSAYNLTAGIGDFTRDGHPDVVARSGRRLFLVPGTATGIGTPAPLAGRWDGYDLISGLGDLTNDRRPDLVARSRDTKLTYIFPGNGRGGFAHRYGPFENFKTATFLAANGQLAGQRSNDLVARNGRGDLLVFTHTGGRNIAGTVDTGSILTDANLLLRVGDWNHDGRGDVMTRTASTGRLQFRAGDGRRGFSAPATVSRGWGPVALLAGVGDMTGDGQPDLMGQPDGGPMRIYPGDGSRGVKPSYKARSAIPADRQVGIGLWTADGAPDTLLRHAGGSLELHPGNGPGGLTHGTSVANGMAGYDWVYPLGDANGDGRADVLVRNTRNGTLWLLRRRGAGFAPPRFLAEGFGRYDLAG